MSLPKIGDTVRYRNRIGQHRMCHIRHLADGRATFAEEGKVLGLSAPTTAFSRGINADWDMDGRDPRIRVEVTKE